MPRPTTIWDRSINNEASLKPRASGLNVRFKSTKTRLMPTHQLGRIARQQERFADAVKNFEQVVARDQTHSQHEIWREVGATYLAAGQFDDARDALERFLEQRPSDPEALYLMGRAHAGLGHRREAASSMQACIRSCQDSAGL